nr:mannitol dehydrogenase family protein [Enterococcus sp. MSG2901]
MIYQFRRDSVIDLKDWQKSLTELKQVGIAIPTYDVAEVKKKGKKSPVWLHFGGGNLYRGFHAEIAQRLADTKELTAGIVVCETFDKQVIDKAYKPFHSDVIEVIMHDDGILDKKLLAATADAFFCHPSEKESFTQVVRYFENPALQFTTFTITEKGYHLKDAAGKFFPVVEADIQNGLKAPQHTISIVTALLHKRFLAGELPIAMISTDNFSQNGKRFQKSVLTIAQGWRERGFVSQAFIEYLTDSEKVAFPWSMIDRITPNPAKVVQTELEKLGFVDMEMIHTEKHTNIAPFVNTEVVHYLVLEDHFPNGRPALEKAGVILASQEIVDKADVMKVTTCLNPLHTAMAITGCLLGYQSIAAEMEDEEIVGLIKAIGYQEGLPVVEDPKIIDPKEFIDEVIEKRLPNPNIPDTPQRIASDTSQKVAIRFGETIKKYAERSATQSLVFIPVAIAAWLRYLLAIDDEGNTFVPSPDPLLTELQEQLRRLHLGEQSAEVIHHSVANILANETIFGSNLYKVGLGEKIEQIVGEMLVGPGAVRKTIRTYLTNFGGK